MSDVKYSISLLYLLKRLFKLYSDYRATERVLAHIGQKVYLPMPQRGDIGRRPSISV
nr:MAG TPA: hypothetical protein [Bacteriophage sp.]